MKYTSKPEKDITSITGHVDPRDLVTNEDIDQGDDQEEDLAWSIAGAYAFLKSEQDEE